MKITSSTSNIHIVDNKCDVFSLINNIIGSDFQEEAFYICNVADIVRKCKAFEKYLPRVKSRYAVKCNDSYEVLLTLIALGVGFDCASRDEIDKILDLGADPSKIIFANTVKPSSHILHAKATGIDLMTFDSEYELYKIKNLYPNARMVLRIRYDDKSSPCNLGNKFGCDPISEAPALLDRAQALGINVVGVSFHVGSNCQTPTTYKKAIAASRKVFDYAEDIGFRFTVLDVGGGFPGELGIRFEKIANNINEALEMYFSDLNVEVLAEPGRYYVTTAYTLCCNIHSKRNSENQRKMYFINDGIYSNFNAVIIEKRELNPIPIQLNKNNNNSDNDSKSPSTVWGQTCNGLDLVMKDALLPEMDIGDWLVFEDMGAYTMVIATKFNGFPIAKTYCVIDYNTWQVIKDLNPFTSSNFTSSSILNGNF